jgi:glucokinase
MTPFDSSRLIADVGGTWARFALETAPGRFEHLAALRCADHSDFHGAVSAYLASVGPQAIRHAAVAIANPVEGDQVRMTNYHWAFSIEQMRERLHLDTLVVVNDFTALAMALPRLQPSQRRQVGGGAPRDRSVIGVLGAGSGLGVSGLIPADGGWVALGTEGGHTSFAPRDEREIGILRYALTQYDHVSFERLLSGPGMELIHRALEHRDGLRQAGLAAPEITRRALEQGDARCLETLEVFWHGGLQPRRRPGRVRRHLHRRGHRAAAGRLVRHERLSRALRGKGPLQRLPACHPHLCHHVHPGHPRRRRGDPGGAAARPGVGAGLGHPGPDPARAAHALAGRAPRGRSRAGAAALHAQ